jgi:hypothetical protein
LYYVSIVKPHRTNRWCCHYGASSGQNEERQSTGQKGGVVWRGYYYHDYYFRPWHHRCWLPEVLTFIGSLDVMVAEHTDVNGWMKGIVMVCKRVVVDDMVASFAFIS